MTLPPGVASGALVQRLGTVGVVMVALGDAPAVVASDIALWGAAALLGFPGRDVHRRR